MHPFKYELVTLLKDEESYISGEEMLKRAKDQDVLPGKEDYEYFLAHQDEIPEEWREYYLVFPGEIRDSDRNRLVGYLGAGGGQWELRWGWLGYDFGRDDRLPRRARKSLETGKVGSSVLGYLDQIEELTKKIREELCSKS